MVVFLKCSRSNYIDRLAAYLDGGPACASVGALTLRAGLAHVPLGPNSSYIHHTPHNIGQFLCIQYRFLEGDSDAVRIELYDDVAYAFCAT